MDVRVTSRYVSLPLLLLRRRFIKPTPCGIDAGIDEEAEE